MNRDAQAPGMLPTRVGGENEKGRFPLPAKLGGSGPDGRRLTAVVVVAQR